MEAFDIVILAMIAGFIILRLRAELGKKTGDEPPYPPHQMPRDMMGDSQGGRDNVTADVRVDSAETGHVVDLSSDPAVRDGLARIRRADSRFNPAQFLEGAAAAYRMILEAFWSGDRDTLATFLSDDVYQQFVGAVESRDAAGHVLDNRVLDIDGAVIDDASLEGRTASITVHFTSDIVAVTRDSEGYVVEGNVSDTVTVNDIWTFARDTKASDPNWQLVATRSA